MALGDVKKNEFDYVGPNLFKELFWFEFGEDSESEMGVRYANLKDPELGPSVVATAFRDRADKFSHPTAYVAQLWGHETLEDTLLHVALHKREDGVMETHATLTAADGAPVDGPGEAWSWYGSFLEDLTIIDDALARDLG